MRYVGAHVSASGGLRNCIKNGEALGVNTIQTMFSAPMRWSTKEIPQTEIEQTIEAANSSSVKKILFHGVYLINLARKEKQMFHLSKLSVATHIDAARRLAEEAEAKGVDLEVLGVTFHPGAAKDLTPEEGIERISYGLNWIIDEVSGGGMILLESSAGAGAVMGDTLEELAAMRDGVDKKERVGYVLDTQHMFVSGYDWVNELEAVIGKIESVLGLENVKCFHLNDSMKPFNSKKDRHANLGEGEIGMEIITSLVNHPKLKNIPFVLETPGLKTVETAQLEVDKLKRIAVD